MTRKEGFTLIELMIVVAIIAIIAAIAIPNIISATMAGRETAAMGSIRSLTACQETWKKSNYDHNAYEDYWTYDLSCMYRMKDAAGNVIKSIDIQFAKADVNPAADNAFGAGYIDPWSGVISGAAKGGYWFRAMATDENGATYLVNVVPATGTVPACNTYKWAVNGYPAAYGGSGRRSFILNEEGVIYARDTGTGSATTQWPAKDPSSVGWTKPE